MPKTRINCPNCRQPIVADVEQLFDMGTDPSAKQKLLSGSVNFIQCPNCGYQGSLATPIVYHDPGKELLLTFVPPEIGLPRDEQERLIGGLINQAVNSLPQEKRKAYLLRPQTALTMQGLVERVLEADGITHEMIQAQQQRLNLIQRLMSVTSDDVLAEIAKQEDKLIDMDFFNLLRRLIDASTMGGDQESANKLNDLQARLLPLTTVGRELESQSKEIEAAVSQLQAAGRNLNRPKLLDMVSAAPNETRLRAFVSLARPVMDYSFFQLLSERIERASGEERKRLMELREKLLAMTHELDQQVEQRVHQAQAAIEEILSADDISEAMLQNLANVDEFFLQELNTIQEEARRNGDLDKLGRLQKIVDILQQASSAPPEIQLLEELLDAPNDAERQKILEANDEAITPEFMSAMANIAAQVDAGEDKETAERVRELNRMVLRYSMQKNMRG